MVQKASVSLRVEAELLDWIRTEATREHRTPTQMARVLVIEARQARETARTNGQHTGHPHIPGQITIDDAATPMTSTHTP
jgi:hypothetical protein